ncbi:MAG: asparagine synthase (glutamine-hydrolyzing) [Candidatus Methanoperedens sp.]|nr:asparagine synthase (glutamine-hydrolyzing) [Candidatus Methanoperedens sp.]
MCGIAGIVGEENNKLARAMSDLMVHRGPDGSGMFSDKNISMAHRRLSIIDIEGGHQPIHNENESVWIIYNGEIYNYRELMQDLEKKGHRFYTQSDTEVIVHAYEEYKEDFVSYLRGMFAFALWDGNSKKLILGRDPLGEKPLYYSVIDNALIFSSEIKSILLHKKLLRDIDHTAVYNFLMFRYVPAPRTFFSAIKKLPAGHMLIYKNNSIELKKYWDFKINPGYREDINYHTAKLFEELKNNVKIRLMSEVPLGAYLSGGIDSSSIVALMSSLSDEPVKTFSIGFPDEKYSELKYARLVSERFGTDHREFVLEPQLDILPTLIWHMDEPLGDPTTIPTYILSKMSKKYVSVVLTGEGADEIFGGYEHYKIISAADRYVRKLPPTLRALFPFIAKSIPYRYLDMVFKYGSDLGEEGINRFSKFIQSVDSESDRYTSIVSIFDSSELNALFDEETKKEFCTEFVSSLRDVYFKETNSDYLSRLMYFETKYQVPDQLLSKVDKMTMANSVEARVPFLDHRLVEYAFSIPSSFKLKGLTEKFILKETMKTLLPRSIIKRKKTRFFVPIHSWFNGELMDIAQQVLSEKSVKNRGCFKSSSIQSILGKFNSSRLYYSRQLWLLLMLELWHRMYIDSESTEPPKKLSKLV